LRAKRDSGGPVLVAARTFTYGEGILREAPLLLVPKDSAAFLKSSGTDAMIAIAQRLRDTSRLAAFAAFCRLPEPQRQELLAMGVSESCTLVRDTKRVVGMFLNDFPQFAGAIDWDHFCHVVGVVSDRGSLLANGDRVLHRLSSHAEHSCSPNAVVETLDESGVREVRAIAHRGISENEAITVSYLKEEDLVLPLKGRKDAMKSMGRGWTCACARCARGEDPVDAMCLLQSISKAAKDMGEEALRKHVQDLKALDASLPFAFVGKARLRSKLGHACEGCDGAVLQKEAVALYEAAIDETVIVLGQKGWRNASNIKKRLEELQEQMD